MEAPDRLQVHGPSVTASGVAVGSGTFWRTRGVGSFSAACPRSTQPDTLVQFNQESPREKVHSRRSPNCGRTGTCSGHAHRPGPHPPPRDERRRAGLRCAVLAPEHSSSARWPLTQPSRWRSSLPVCQTRSARICPPPSTGSSRCLCGPPAPFPPSSARRQSRRFSLWMSPATAPCHPPRSAGETGVSTQPSPGGSPRPCAVSA